MTESQIKNRQLLGGLKKKILNSHVYHNRNYTDRECTHS